MPHPPKRPKIQPTHASPVKTPEPEALGQDLTQKDEDGAIATLDEVFEAAGLVRNRRDRTARLVPHARFQKAVSEDLSPQPAAPETAPNGVQWFPVPGWKNDSWLWHAFSSRRSGVSWAYCPEDATGERGELNLGFTAEDERSHVQRNRGLLAEAVTGSADTPLITLRQIHSSVLVLGASSGEGPGRSGAPCRGDALMTDTPGLLLGIQTADCIPVLVADRRRRAVAAFHAGWRGTVKRIVELGIGRMRLEFGSSPEDLAAAIGPGIGACCYAVGEEVVSEFESQFSYAPDLFREVYAVDPVQQRYPMLFLTQRAPGHSTVGPNLHLDLVEANRRQLVSTGLRPSAIQVVGGCTNCHPELFFSHRHSRGRCGRMMSVIGVRPN